MTKETGINQLKRRDFLKAGLVFGAGASGLAAGYAAVPDAFARAVYAAKREGIANDNILVMIQLAGGNDGLRTLVPLADPTQIGRASCRERGEIPVGAGAYKSKKRRR